MVFLKAFNSHPVYRVGVRGTLFIVRFVLETENIRNARVNIVFTDDRTIIHLNGTFLRKWKTTDVISFPFDDEVNTIEGEVYVNLDQARRQARVYKVTYKKEYSRLIAHGLLHLIGYRDDSASERKRMLRCENSVLDKLEKVRYIL